MNEEARKQVVEKLDQLKEQVTERLGSDPASHDAVTAHVDEVRTLVQGGAVDKSDAQRSASHLERRLLAWEAEHPELTALASRIARALEDAGL